LSSILRAVCCKEEWRLGSGVFFGWRRVCVSRDRVGVGQSGGATRGGTEFCGEKGSRLGLRARERDNRRSGMEGIVPSILVDRCDSLKNARPSAERQAASSEVASAATNEKPSKAAGQSLDVVDRDSVMEGNAEDGEGNSLETPVTRFLSTERVVKRGRRSNREMLDREKGIPKGYIEKWLGQGGGG